MEKYLQSLNESQLKAVTTNSQYVRVIAGAGSGKTRVLTTRIVHVVKSWGVDPRKILAITFTNKAANEMRTRINAEIEAEAGKLHVSTIHSFCVTILRRDIKHLGYPVNFTILDQDDQKSIVKESFKALSLDSKSFSVNALLEYIAGMKYAEIDGDEAMKRAHNRREEDKARIYAFYLRRQHELYALDFDDLLLWTVRLFRTHATVREYWQKRFQFILVDEFQDIDNTQYVLIRLLSTENTYIYVVGDPDQTIYTWRGANINIIMNFEYDFKPCETIVLERNYRSTKTILNAANSLIKFNRNRVEKNLYTENEEGTMIVHYRATSEDAEAQFVARKILEHINSGGDYSDCAVLYRSNYISRAFEKCFMDYKIPYILYGAVRFFERKEIKDALCYLRMLVARDDLSFKRIVNVPKRGIGDKTVDVILEEARASGTTMFEAARTVTFSPKTRKTLDDFIAKVDDWSARSTQLTPEQSLQMVLDESGYLSMLENSEDSADLERVENIKELINDINDFCKNNPEATLDEYLQFIALYMDIQSDRSGNSVSMMTVHSAKGLEFDNVFVVGLCDGVFPSDRSMEEGLKGLEEERRLAYVAFTRARKNLFLTESMGYNFASSSSKVPSRFLDEVDEAYIQTAGVRPQIEKVKTFDEDDEFEHVVKVKRKPSDIRAGDLVEHDDFGEGVVISVNGNFGDILFKYPYNLKTLSLNFPKLHKKKKES